jgi:small subunit ribosomal protein S17
MENKRKTKVGSVVSNKMEKTVVVTVETLRHHPLYKKTIKKAVNYKAHDEHKACQTGDVVRIMETCPVSKEKRWKVIEIITRKQTIEVKPQDIDSPDRTESNDTAIHTT